MREELHWLNDWLLSASLLILVKAFKKANVTKFSFESWAAWGEVKKISQVHMAGQWSSQLSNPGLLAFALVLNMPSKSLLSRKKTSINGSCLFISWYIINWGFEYSNSLDNTYSIVSIYKHYTSCNTSWCPQRATWISHEFINLFAISVNIRWLHYQEALRGLCQCYQNKEGSVFKIRKSLFNVNKRIVKFPSMLCRLS